MSETLTRRALNRATLARQFLLQRTDRPALDVVQHLAGLQAQTPQTWYTGLWSRIGNFDAAAFGDLLTNRHVVRIALMRGTIHLVTAGDAAEMRPLVAQVIERGTQGSWGRYWKDLDREALAEAGHALVDEKPLTFAELGRALALQWPDHDPGALAQSIRSSIPLVQTPPRGVWGKSGLAKHTSLESWLDRPVATNPSIHNLALRYLAAFGPATVKDFQTWSGLTRMAEVFDGLRAQLVTFADEHGRELFDLLDAPRPDADAPAPVRFLYDYDNLLLSHADRSRLITELFTRQDFPADGPQPSSVLIDGFVGATWIVEKTKTSATLTIRPFTKLSKQVAAEVETEGMELLQFLASDKTHNVQFASPEDG